MLYCYNLSKTYREIAGDIIQILYIAVMIKLNGFNGKDKPPIVTKIETNIETNIEKHFRFIELTDFLRNKIDTGKPPDPSEKPSDYDVVVEPDVKGSPTKPYVLSELNIPIRPINLNDGLECIDALFKIFSNHATILTEVRTGGIKCIDFLIERISKKLNLKLVSTETSTNYTHLITELNTFITHVERVIENDHIGIIKKTNELIKTIYDSDGKVILQNARRVNKTNKVKPATNNKTNKVKVEN